MPRNKIFCKGLVVGIIVLFIGSNFVSGTNIQLKNITISNSSSRGNILYVGGSGSGNYTKIQNAIDNASNGDTVFVFDDSSPYYEHLIVYKSIYLIGEDKNTTIIDGSDSGYVVTLTKNEITISGFTIQKGGPYGSDYSGMRISSNYNKINNNIILSSGYGILISGMSYNIISNNTISYNGRGVMILGESNDNLVIRNNIIDNDGGICLFNTGGRNPSNNIVSWNNIKNNPVFGILTLSQNRLIICNNNIENSEIGIDLYTSQLAVVKCNNLINLENDAYFVDCYCTRWSRNYWDEWNGFGPYKIKGIRIIMIGWDEYGNPIYDSKDTYNFDWHPAKKPYDITKEIIKESNIKCLEKIWFV